MSPNELMTLKAKAQAGMLSTKMVRDIWGPVQEGLTMRLGVLPDMLKERNDGPVPHVLDDISGAITIASVAAPRAQF